LYAQISEAEVTDSGLSEQCKSLFTCISSSLEWETSLGTGVKSLETHMLRNLPGPVSNQ